MNPLKYKLVNVQDVNNLIDSLKETKNINISEIEFLLSKDFMLNWMIPLSDSNLRENYRDIILNKFEDKSLLFTILVEKCQEGRMPAELNSHQKWQQNGIFAIILPFLHELIFNQLDLLLISLCSHDFQWIKIWCTRFSSVPDIVMKLSHPSSPKSFQKLFAFLFNFFPKIVIHVFFFQKVIISRE